MHALVIGHSFVDRAKQFLLQGKEGTRCDLLLSDLHITWEGYSGLSLRDLDLKSHVLFAQRPDILLIDIGTNDLCSVSADPHRLAQSAFKAAVAFLDMPSIQCMFLFCPRAIHSRYPARVDFNDCVDLYNVCVRELCSASISSSLPVWSQGHQADLRLYLSHDGVHLSSRPPCPAVHSGIFKYLMSVRTALVRAFVFASLFDSSCEYTCFMFCMCHISCLVMFNVGGAL